jgi:hypothetical protein
MLRARLAIQGTSASWKNRRLHFIAGSSSMALKFGISSLKAAPIIS